jgi:Glycosyl transferase family 2
VNIVGAIRVKNEARWIKRVVDAMSPLCQRIVVLDDHSDDDTATICDDLECDVISSPFEHLNEAGDKNFLISRCGSADWILMMDGDEVLLPDGVDMIRKCAQQSTALAFSFHILYAWDREDQIRTDGIYRDFWRGRMFRPVSGSRFEGKAPGFHCYSVPPLQRASEQRIPGRVLHLGYLHRADRIRKYQWYNRMDPNNEAEDWYRHMVQGDLPEVPAGATLKHAGPLRLEKI